MLSRLKRRWKEPFGYRDVLNVGLPLVVSLGSTTAMEFTDRIFLSNYSLISIAAALPAAMVNLVFLLFAMGISAYSSVFIAQYYGACKYEKIGSVVWQAIYFCCIAWVLLASLALVAEPFFAFVGHAPEVQREEVVYFSILTVGSGCALVANAIGCFFTGLGKTRPNMVVNVIAVIINIPLDYMLINGVWFFPEMGIAGAGLATVSSWAMQIVMYAMLVFTRKNDTVYNVIRAWRFNKNLFLRMMRYGIPSGLNNFFDVFAFTMFIMVIGRLGEVELAASNIVLSINSLAFLPVVGLNIAASILVGQAMGRKDVGQATVAAHSVLHVALLWMGTFGAIFILFPYELTSLFKPADISAEQFANIQSMCQILLAYVALFCIQDAIALVFFGSLKGAGDTMYVMWAIAICATLGLGVPMFIGRFVFDAGLHVLWGMLIAYVCTLALAAYLRFRGGKWQHIQMIEQEPSSC
ncbi:MATE family efflux transporter [Halodesulfovibrio marinisediminis]|uniref:Multidrug-efflux transporter n=1 Tax=Halodesulfovibrio marinisediminis DSM 17456 TaxID=1121457 RepID=A0A1N6DGW5_9BACT|nr:MATE family efflux transporter [Halodesulfovibrio marinisediminis]SIN70032.1 multidrug resistance protein, MATE family [Halodesulfovibrio marinisediminis DSM 17456]